MKGHSGLLTAAVLVALGQVLGAAASSASTGPAGECGALRVTARPDADPPSLVLTLPSSLGAADVGPGSVTVDQQGPVRVASVRALRPAKLDLAIVLDTAADTPDPVMRRARAVVSALLDSLPDQVAVTVVSAGGPPDVVSLLGTNRADDHNAVIDAPRGRGHAWLDGIALAASELPDDPDRFAQVVVVTTGPDDASVRDAVDVRALVEERPVAVSVTSAGDPPGEQEWLDECPAEVDEAQAASAGELMARRLVGRHVVVVQAADLAAPLTVRVRDGAVDASAATAAAAASVVPDTSVLGTKVGPADAGDAGSASSPFTTLVIGLVVILLLALSVTALVAFGLAGRLLGPAGPRLASWSLTRGRRVEREAVDELVTEAWVARVCLLSVPAAGLLVRLQRDGAAPTGAPALGLAALAAAMTVVGVWWLWRSTSPPYPVWWKGRVSSSGPRVTAAAPFVLCLLPAALLIVLG